MKEWILYCTSTSHSAKTASPARKTEHDTPRTRYTQEHLATPPNRGALAVAWATGIPNELNKNKNKLPCLAHPHPQSTTTHRPPRPTTSLPSFPTNRQNHKPDKTHFNFLHVTFPWLAWGLWDSKVWALGPQRITRSVTRSGWDASSRERRCSCEKQGRRRTALRCALYTCHSYPRTATTTTTTPQFSIPHPIFPLVTIPHHRPARIPNRQTTPPPRPHRRKQPSIFPSPPIPSHPIHPVHPSTRHPASGDNAGRSLSLPPPPTPFIGHHPPPRQPSSPGDHAS